MKKILYLILAISSTVYAASNTLTISPIVPFPATVVSGSTISNIKYNVHNNSDANSYPITFYNLTSPNISYTTTCATLTPGGDCTYSITFTAETLPPSVSKKLYVHNYAVRGAPTQNKQVLTTTIVPSQPLITPQININLSGGATTVTDSYDVLLTPTGAGTQYNCPSIPFGTSNFCEAIAPGNYNVEVSPSTVVGSDSFTYDAPAKFSQNLTPSSHSVNISYTKNQDLPVSTDITAPNYDGAGFSIQLKGDSGTYTHTQTSGTEAFDNVPAGNYVVTAPASYVGTDAKTYIVQLTNPYTISPESETVAIAYVEQAPETEHVKTNITAPNLPSSSTVLITADDGVGDAYSHQQGSGLTTFDTMVDGSYTVTAADYSVGPDQYQATLSNPYAVDSTHTEIDITYSKIPSGGTYNWQASHLTPLANNNFFAVWWGGGSTTAPVHISSNPPVNDWLNTQIAAYEDGTPTPVGVHAVVKGFPSYVAMGTITETDSEDSATNQLKAQKLDTAFHYEGNGSGDQGCFWDQVGCPNAYTPQVDALAAQEQAVRTTTGHDLVSGTAFYTIDYSDYPSHTIGDISNDTNITAHLYNLMYEVYRMEYQYSQGNQMVLLLNPDSTVVFQNCSQYYCPIQWQPGLSKDTTPVITVPNLQDDVDAAIDRMFAKGYIDKPTANAMKADFVTNAIGVPPTGSGRVLPGLPELILSNSWAIKYLAPHIPFGYGVNEYDNANPLMSPGGAKPWETASFDWIHKINHLGMTQENVQAGVQYEAQKFASYMSQMNLSGSPVRGYEPDFIFFDRYERDVIPGYVPSGFMMNGVDLDTYLLYMHDFDVLADNIPLALWQMPGATMHTTPSAFDKFKNLFKFSQAIQSNYYGASHKQKTANSKKVKTTVPVDITTNITATGLGSSTVAITLDDSPLSDTYTHNQGVGSTDFGTINTYDAGTSYTLTSATYDYNGTTYYAVCSNPYYLNKQNSTINLTYAAKVAVTVSFEAPHLGSTDVDVLLQGGCYEYEHETNGGAFDNIVPDNYSATAAAYAFGGKEYYQIPHDPYAISAASTNVTIAYGYLGDTVGNWVFGTPELKNDLSNLDPDQNMDKILFNNQDQTIVYYTKNSNVKNAVDYLKLTNASP